MRHLYEGMIIAVLLVQNVPDVNRKLKRPEGAETPEDRNYQKNQQSAQ